MAEARAADRASMPGYSAETMSTGLMRAADMAQQHRVAEAKSMADFGQYRTLDLAQKARAQENESMTAYNNARSALLDTIAGTESPGYNVMYGGSTFTDFTDHPRVAHEITVGPNAGLTSTAAGKYQFLSSTWDRVAAELGLTDFTPASQDKAALHLAAQDYKAATGRNLDADLAAGNIGNIAKGLSGTWTSLPGGIEATTTVDRFTRSYRSNLAERTNSPPSQVGSTPSPAGRFPSTTKAIPTTRSSFGDKYLGDGLALPDNVPVPTSRPTLGNGLPDEIGTVPTARPSPIASTFPARPAGLPTGLPAATVASTFPSRPEGLATGLPAAPAFQSDFPARPEGPASGLPAEDAAPSTFPARPEAPRSFEDKYLTPRTTNAVRPAGPASGLPAEDARPSSFPARPEGLATGLPSAPPSIFAARPEGLATGLPAARQQTTVAGRPEFTGPLPAAQRSPARALQDVRDIKGPVSMGGPGGIYVGGVPGGRSDQDVVPDAQTAGATAETPAPFNPPSTTPARSRSPNPYSAPADIEEKDTLGEKLLAGGLDVLGGLIPGVGTAVTAANLGLSLFGKDTIGERIADAIFDGDNQYQPGSTAQQNTSGGSRRRPRKSRFASKYLRPAGDDEAEDGETHVAETPYVDADGRPTPYQKWVEGRNYYPAQA